MEMGVIRRVRARALAELDEPSVKEVLSDPSVHAVMRIFFLLCRQCCR